jgi:hypothetical protein
MHQLTSNISSANSSIEYLPREGDKNYSFTEKKMVAVADVCTEVG